MADILPFPTDYLPTHEETIRLEGIQRQISLWRVELIREWDRQFFNAGQRYLSKEIFHNGIRGQWKIYQGLNQKSYKYLELK